MVKLIEIERFENNSGRLYFRHLGEKQQTYKIAMSTRNLTLYYVELTFEVNKDMVYFIGFNHSVLDYIDNVEITFQSENFFEKFNFHIKELTKSWDLPNLKTKIEDPSFYTYHEIFNEEIYENKLIRINEGDIVVDIGANYGFFSLYAEKFKPSKIISIEPSKSIFKYLDENFIHGEKIQKAVSGKTGVKRFLDNQVSSASSKLTDDEGYEVEVIGINDLITSLGLEKIDFLKIDCEGDEEKIFEDITLETLDKINKLVVEFHSDKIKEIIINKLNLYEFKIEKITSGLIFAYNKNYYKNKKKIALVSTYCDTQEKKDIFLDLVKKVKSLGVDVIAISPLPLDKEHIEACDYIFFTKENPILEWPIRLFSFWYEQNIGDGKFLTFQRGVGDYNWAALYHVKKMTQIAMDYDYDIFYHMIYDLEIDDNVERALKNFEGNIVYPRRDPNNPETIWETTLHFMSFDRDLMNKIEKEITLDEYLSTNGVAEGEVLKWKRKFKIYGSENPVKDKIYYWKDYDFFNYSPFKEFKMFISKNELMDIWLGVDPAYITKLTNNLRIVFYNGVDIESIDIIIDGITYEISPKMLEIIELPVNSKNIETIRFKYNNQEIDFSSEYEKISLNQIYINHKP